MRAGFDDLEDTFVRLRQASLPRDVVEDLDSGIVALQRDAESSFTTTVEGIGTLILERGKFRTRRLWGVVEINGGKIDSEIEDEPLQDVKKIRIHRPGLFSRMVAASRGEQAHFPTDIEIFREHADE